MRGGRLLRMAGELAMIFLGITAALWFENANDARHQRALETQILHEMRADLTRDTTDLNRNLVLGESVLASIDTVLASLQSGAAYHESLAEHFAWSSRFFRFFHNPAAYEHLRSAGLDVISDDSLRSEIIVYYDGSVPLLMWIDGTIVQGWLERELYPRMVENFEYTSSEAPAVPVDFAALRRNVEYQSALRRHAYGVRNQLFGNSGAATAAEALLARIDRTLQGRD